MHMHDVSVSHPRYRQKEIADGKLRIAHKSKHQWTHSSAGTSSNSTQADSVHLRSQAHLYSYSRER